MTGSPGPAPRHTQRVRVTATRRGAPRARPRPMATALVEQTGAGELYLQGLLRAQLRLALLVVSGVAAVLGGLAALLALTPLGTVSLAGVPVAWLLLGLLSWPAMVLAARAYVARVDRLEHTFTDVLTNPELPAGR